MCLSSTRQCENYLLSWGPTLNKWPNWFHQVAVKRQEGREGGKSLFEDPSAVLLQLCIFVTYTFAVLFFPFNLLFPSLYFFLLCWWCRCGVDVNQWRHGSSKTDGVSVDSLSLFLNWFKSDDGNLAWLEGWSMTKWRGGGDWLADVYRKERIERNKCDLKEMEWTQCTQKKGKKNRQINGNNSRHISMYKNTHS